MTSYLTPKEYSERYKVKVSTLAQLRCKKTGPKFIRIGRLIRYLEITEEAA